MLQHIALFIEIVLLIMRDNKILSHQRNNKYFVSIVGTLYIIFYLIPLLIFRHFKQPFKSWKYVKFLLNNVLSTSYVFRFNYLAGGLNGPLTHYMVRQAKLSKNSFDRSLYRAFFKYGFEECVNYVQTEIKQITIYTITIIHHINTFPI